MKTLITSAMIIASLALAGNAAMAADTHVHKSTRVAHVSHARAAVHVAARRHHPRVQRNDALAQFFQFFFGGWPAQYAGPVHYAGKTVGSYSYSGSDYSPSYDNSPAIDSSSAATESQAASDAVNQAIQSMNDTNAATASMAAAEAANDAANAATLQTEINAGM
jgi:hypothetical protein